MFSLLFDSGFWYDLIFIAAAVFLMYLVIKYPQGRIYFFTFLSLAFIGVTIFCGVNLNTYLSAQGGIFGSLSGAFGLDKVEVVDNQTFELNNLSMTLQTDGSYALEVSVNKKLELDSNKTYGIFVNDVPTNLVDSQANYIASEYSYNFYDANSHLLCADTLSIRVAMYANSTLLHVSTQGGSDACKYWNNYFNKNSFKIKIDDVVYVGDGIVTGGEGDISNFAKVNYMVDGNVYSTAFYQKNTTVTTFPEAPYKQWYTFEGWSIDGQNIIKSLLVTHDTSIQAVFSEGENIVKEVITVEYDNISYAMVDLSTLTGVDLSNKDIEVTFTYTLANPLLENAYGEIIIAPGEEISITNNYGNWATVMILQSYSPKNCSLYFANSGYASTWAYATIEISKIIVYP